jgi:predicted DNA-binding ribbon-helix-helix protein
MPSYLSGPVKRSVTIAGHQTSISLEPLFWDALREEAEHRGLPLNALIAQIDLARISVDDPPNLASAIRLWLFHHNKRDSSNRMKHNRALAQAVAAG